MKNCFYPADILLPEFANDSEKMTIWSSIACDQYTSEPEYWAKAEKVADGKPSTLHITLPENYLFDAEARIPVINNNMKIYIENVLKNYPSSMIYLERTQKNGKIRRGLVGTIDLECYDYTKGAESLVRATEGTVLERIPPRVKIREGAAIELPHIMILIDDPECTVIEPLIKNSEAYERAYDFDLMLGGGHALGRFLPKNEISRINDALESLYDKAAKQQNTKSPLLFAVGDGNHSLATAKACWEKIKLSLTEEEIKTHPARFALCEIVNIHDKALEFEPIYRVVFGVSPDELVSEFEKILKELPKSEITSQNFKYITSDNEGDICAENPSSVLPVGTLQAFLDKYIPTVDGAYIDYIHGVESTRKLCADKNAVGFIFDGMKKSELFVAVAKDGALPRKTFSMGEADDKRFYLEARKIIK